MQPVLGRALGRPVCRRRPVDGYRQNPPSWNAKTRPEDGKTALCINLWGYAGYAAHTSGNDCAMRMSSSMQAIGIQSTDQIWFFLSTQ